MFQLTRATLRLQSLTLARAFSTRLGASMGAAMPLKKSSRSWLLTLGVGALLLSLAPVTNSVAAEEAKSAAGIKGGIERTFIAIKPDGTQRSLVGQVVSRFEQKGYKLVAIKAIVPSRSLAEKHYEDLSTRPFFGGLVKYMTSGAAPVRSFDYLYSRSLPWYGKERMSFVKVVNSLVPPIPWMRNQERFAVIFVSALDATSSTDRILLNRQKRKLLSGLESLKSTIGNVCLMRLTCSWTRRVGYFRELK